MNQRIEYLGFEVHPLNIVLNFIANTKPGTGYEFKYKLSCEML